MIIKNNEDTLRVTCARVCVDEIADLVLALESELRQSGLAGFPGIGLAAPQIGIAKSIAIVRISPTESINLINASIVSATDKTMFRQEGCLSFPNRAEDTMRFQRISVTGDTIHKTQANGLFAVAIQHELDHLNGILLPDKKIIPQVKLLPNEPCYCGSGKKFKKCCR
jgi:peptide deformylase